MKTSRTGAGFAALIFFLTAGLALGSGRLDSSDAHAQLQAATSLALTGCLGRVVPPADTDPSLWLQGVTGGWYEVHDVGAALFMTPTVWAATRFSKEPADELVNRPPAHARVAAALSYSLLGGVVAWLMFITLSRFYSLRVAWLLTAGFAFTTPLLAYSRAAWDVLGGCAGVASVLAASAAALRSAGSGRNAPGVAVAGVGAAVAVGLAASFRLSLLPFLLPAAGAVAARALWRGVPGGRRRAAVALVWAATLALALLPSAWYNCVRSGDPLRSAATGQYTAADALQGEWVHGVYGLLIAPNRGLLPFAPVFLLLAALPVAWRSLDRELRSLLVWFGAGTAAYILALAKMQNWSGNAGWGPRYLVPVLPVFYLAVAPVAVWAWHRPPLRAWLVALSAASALVNAPALFVDHSLAALSWPGATDPESALPSQQAAAWHALSLWVRGRELPPHPQAARDPVRALAQRPPDLWVVHLYRHPATRVAGVPVTMLLLVLMIWSGLVLREASGPPDSGASSHHPRLG